MTRDMVQPRKSGTFFRIRRISTKNPVIEWKPFHAFLLPRWLQDANSPALSGKVGVKRAASVGGQQFAKVARFFLFAAFKSIFNSDFFRWLRLECEVTDLSILKKLLSWPKLENLGRLHETPEKIIISLAQLWKSKGLVFLMYHPPASLLTVLRFCMTNVSLNISQLHLWPFDAKSDL